MGRAKHRKLRRAVCRMAGQVGADLAHYRSMEMPLPVVLVSLTAKEMVKKMVHRGLTISVGGRPWSREELTSISPDNFISAEALRRAMGA